MPDIKLNFINRSADKKNAEVVIFQKNQSTNQEELTVAWLVIENCGYEWNHPFVYPMDMVISASDSCGNFSKKLGASNGQQFQVVRDGSGDILKYAGQASSPDEVEVYNALHTGAIVANVYKDGRLLSTKTGIAPRQKAVFEFKPIIWIGLASDIEEGQVMGSSVLSQVNTELSLFGIRSADIVLSGGGNDSNATALEFTLENVVYTA